MSNDILKTYHNKDYGLIDLDALAGYYNEVLGASFVVKANCIPIPLEDDRTTCTLYATRVPFAIADVRSETLTLTLNFRVAWFPEDERKKALEEMKRLLGYQRFVIQEDITLRSLTEKQNAQSGEEGFEIKDDMILKTFNCTSFLEMTQSVGVPQTDCGKTILDMQITGTVLVTDADGGAVMSNDVVTFAKLVGSSANPVPLPIVYSSTNEGYNVENQVGTGAEMQVPVPLTAQGGLTIQALYLARDFEKQLLVGLKNKAQKQIEITEVYDSNLTVVRVYNVLSMSEAKQAGAYMQYTLELQASSQPQYTLEIHVDQNVESAMVTKNGIELSNGDAVNGGDVLMVSASAKSGYALVDVDNIVQVSGDTNINIQARKYNPNLITIVPSFMVAKNPLRPTEYIPTITITNRTGIPIYIRSIVGLVSMSGNRLIDNGAKSIFTGPSKGSIPMAEIQTTVIYSCNGTDYTKINIYNTQSVIS